VIQLMSYVLQRCILLRFRRNPLVTITTLPERKNDGKKDSSNHPPWGWCFKFRERFVLPSNFLLASSPILYTDLKAQMTKSKEQDHDRVFAQTGRWVP
jgi:hypothetical protein